MPCANLRHISSQYVVMSHHFYLTPGEFILNFSSPLLCDNFILSTSISFLSLALCVYSIVFTLFDRCPLMLENLAFSYHIQTNAIGKEDFDFVLFSSWKRRSHS